MRRRFARRSRSRCRGAESWTRCATKSARSRAGSSPSSAPSRRSKDLAHRPPGVAGIERIVRCVGQSRLRDASHDEPIRHRFAPRIRSELNCDRAGGAGPSTSARAGTSAPESGHLAGNGSRTSTANGDRRRVVHARDQGGPTGRPSQPFTMLPRGAGSCGPVQVICLHSADTAAIADSAKLCKLLILLEPASGLEPLTC